MKKSAATRDEAPSRLIDERIEELGDWRGKMLSQLRALIKQADPEVVEEWKWGDSGVVARRIDLHRRDLQEGREDDLRQGAPRSRTRRASSTPASRATPGARSTFSEGEKIDEKALKALIRAAVKLNVSRIDAPRLIPGPAPLRSLPPRDTL